MTDAYYAEMPLEKLLVYAVAHNCEAKRALRMRRPDLADDLLGKRRPKREYTPCGKDLAVKD